MRTHPAHPPGYGPGAVWNGALGQMAEPSVGANKTT